MNQNHHFLPTDLFPKSNQYEVLVVDDMAVNRVLLAKILVSSGYKVVEADSAEQAIQMIQRGYTKPNAIITDVEMPEMDGITLTEIIRDLPGGIANIPIIVASGNPDPDMEMDAYDAGADAFMSKPFNLGELRAAVAEAVQHSKNTNFRFKDRTIKREINALRTRLA